MARAYRSESGNGDGDGLRSRAQRSARSRGVVSSLLALALAVGCEPLFSIGLEDDISVQVARARRVAREVGVHIVEADGWQTIFEHEADRSMIVASNTKLVTTAAALDTLGPGFLFETRILLRGEVVGDRLYGDLVVVGAGDPNISGRRYDEDPLAPLREWAKRLAGFGIRRVHGALYLVHGLFDDQHVHADWPRNQLARWYEAPVESLSFNDNCVLVRVFPGARGGSRAMVQIVPDLGQMRIENAATTTTSARRHLVVVDRRPGSNTIRVSGHVLQGASPVEAWVTVADPVAYFGDAFVRALREEGVEIGAGWRAAQRIPAGEWRIAFEHRSDLLSTVEVINRQSQNFFAESLMKMLGAKVCAEGSWGGGLQVVTAFLERAGISGDYSMVDGSGMSRNNRFSARQLTTLLAYMTRHRWNTEYIRSLPFSGLADHPSWRKRLSEEPYKGNVIAKTGSLRGVTTLSGYARGRSGTTYVFSILLNRARSVGAGRTAQDRILRELIDKG